MKKYMLSISFVLMSAYLLTIIFNFNLSIVSLTLIVVGLLFCIVHIKPQHMNRLFGKKQKNVDNNMG